MENRDKIFNLVVFSMLCAFAYVGTDIRIPLPTGAFVHLGNLVCILSALLLGGVKGGLVGTIGMTLFDLFNGYTAPDIFLRTAVLKFLMGFTCGSAFTLIRKKNTNHKVNLAILFTLSAIFFACFAVTLSLYFTDGIMNLKGKLIPVHVLIPISTCLFGALFLVAGIFARTKHPIYQQLLIATSLGTLVNICGEIITKTFVNLLRGFDFVPSAIDAASKSPASLFTGILTIVCACTLFPLLEKALSDKLHRNYNEEKNV